MVLIIMVLLLPAVDAQTTTKQLVNAPLHIDLTKTLAFIMGQQYGLDQIRQKFPDLSLHVKKAELEFNSSFSNAEENIRKHLQEIFIERYFEYLSELQKQVEETLSSQQLTRDFASKFIAEVELRARGEIPSPMLEILLSYQFKNQPDKELQRGFKKIFSTKGHPKAKGLDFHIEYPKSWSSREGHRPNVIQFFSSNNGRGPVYAMIMTRDIIKESKGQLSAREIQSLKTPSGSKKFAAELFADEVLKEMPKGMGMTNVRDIKIKKIVLDGWPGAMLEFVGEQQRLDFTLTMFNRMYVALYKNYMVFLHCQVAKLPEDKEEEFNSRISAYVQLFHLMANSLVIQSQY